MYIKYNLLKTTALFSPSVNRDTEYKLVQMVNARQAFNMQWPGGSVGWSIALYPKRMRVQFPLRARIQVAG